MREGTSQIPKISYYKNGYAVFNAAARDRFILPEGYGFCTLTYDAVRCNIRMCLSKSQVGTAQRLNTNDKSVRLAAAALVNRYNLPDEFSAELRKDEVSGVLLAEVKPEAKPVSPPPRKEIKLKTTPIAIPQEIKVELPQTPDDVLGLIDEAVKAGVLAALSHIVTSLQEAIAWRTKK
jgi:hypothetical protein